MSETNTNSYSELKDKTIDELYEKYKEYVMMINHTSDDKIKDNIKIEIQQIKILLDDKELDEVRLKELNLRNYLSYPDHNNPNFNSDISKKLEFNANKLYFNQQTTCGKDTFELGNHQRLLKNFVNKNTPYKSLLIFHGVGVGKTCSAVTISESFRDIYANDNNKIIVLRKGGLDKGWKNTIFDPKKGEDQCSGHEFIDLINDTDGFNDKEDKSVKRDVNKLIKKYYEFYAYREFSNSIDKLTKHCTNENEERIIINKLFSNRLLIVDEYHNLRDTDVVGDDKIKLTEKDDQKKALKNLLKIIEYSDNLRLILLTATPMFNYSDEIFNLLNILLLNDNRPTIDYKQYLEDGNINSDGLDILAKKFRGYVSYLRGENPINFPIRIYPNEYKDKLAFLPQNAPKMDLFGKRVEIPLKFLITYDNKLNGEQKQSYEKLLSELDKDKKIGIQDSNLTQICNVCYPGSKENEYGEQGFNSYFNSNKNTFTYKKDKKHILSYDLLQSHSIKIKNIIDNIRDSDGIIFIYSEYIFAGALPMALALEHIGFNKYGGNNLLNISEKGTDEGNYIILSGNDKISGNNDEELGVLTSVKNKDGVLIKVVIGSSITGEGMDFKNIRQIHIVDPWWHLSKSEQIVGRGIRYCSHINLPEDKRNVTVFLHTATCDNKETVDHYSYRLGESKSIEVGKVETILKKNALDCYLFKDSNIITDKKKNLKVDVRVSKNKIPKFNKSIEDKPYSKICSYQEECEYGCDNIDIDKLDKLHDVTNFMELDEFKKGMDVSFIVKGKKKVTTHKGVVKEIDYNKNRIVVDLGYKETLVPPSKLNVLDKINDDTTDFTFFKDLKKNILIYLNELYKKNKFYELNDIVDYIQYNKDLNKKVIFNLLKTIIDYKDKVYDVDNNQGYIICKQNIFIFQPLFNNDENVPIFYRNNLNLVNNINVDSITDNIEPELSKLIDEIELVKPLIKDIFKKLKSKYSFLIKQRELIKYKLIIDDNKEIYLESCIDELSYEENKVLMEEVIRKQPYEDIKLTNKEITDEEIFFIVYHYFKNHFIQQVDSKYTLFNNNKETIGYLIMNKEILEYHDLNDGLIDKNIIQGDILNSIRSLDKGEHDKIFKLNKIYIQPFINYSKKPTEIGFRYTYKFYDGVKFGKGVIVGNDPGYTKTLLNRFIKIGIEKYDYLNKNKDKLYGNSVISGESKFKIIQIVIRLEDKSNENNYIISNELNYLRLIK